MTELKTGAWVLVADSDKALFLENVGDAGDYNLQVRRKQVQDNPPTREQGTDRPGRYHDGPSPHHSAMAETDWHALQKDRFAEDLAERLYAAAHRGDFETLVLIATPEILGKLRPHLHKEVTDRLLAEVPKGLTHEPLDRLETHLRAALDSGTGA